MIHADDLRERALRLPIKERAALAADLLASLDGEPEGEVEAAWAAEVERRAHKLLSGEDPGHAWDDVRARLRAEFPR
ncbi:MAG: addiction module protein [Planctomycetes bacterium]|nr:addiction module protein [Planctomycetota bacterium]